MKAINDIIKTDRDRLFVIAPECYIIFTGDSLSDQRPFIRIGNTHDLPSEVIPLTENIVITDIPVGNPAHEQFNIDVNYLAGNRYIGSKIVARWYLELQKAYNLNLSKVTILDVEKDAPQLIKQKKIKDKKSYIGIFYANGNFQLSHENEVLFDLSEANNYYYTENRINSLITEQFSESKRYDGAGFILMDEYTLFYKNGFFTSFEPPLNYYDDFCKLQIDQSKIREILFPHSNALNALPIIKWKHNNKRVLKVFDDNKDRVAMLQKIYMNCHMNIQMFHGMSYNTGEGLTFDTGKKSANVLVQYTAVLPGRDQVQIGYINDYNYEFVLDAKPDVIIIKNEIFNNIEELIASNTSLKLIAVDKTFKGNYNKQHIYLHNAVQYELKKYNNKDEFLNMLKDAIIDKKIADSLNNLSSKTISSLKKALPNPKHSGLNEYLDANNCRQILILEEKITANNSYRRTLQKLIQLIDKTFSEQTLVADYLSAFKITLCMHAGSVIKLYEPVALRSTIPSYIFDDFNENTLELAKHYKDPGLYESYKQIEVDRERLKQLLALYYNKGTVKKKSAAELKVAIDLRKKKYTKEVKKKFIKKDKQEIKPQLRTLKIKKIKRFLFLLLVPVLLALLGYGGYYGYSKYEEHRLAELERKRIETEKQQIAEEKARLEKERERLVKEYNIRVSDYDIYIYANKVALKNGYKRIDLKHIRENNPNWIFPGNVFVLLDGERITVIKGNTLWGISERKLMKRQVLFYTLIDKIKKNISSSENTQRLVEAKKYAFAKRHFAELKRVRKLLKNQ